jgi:hypothetical protein
MYSRVPCSRDPGKRCAENIIRAALNSRSFVFMQKRGRPIYFRLPSSDHVALEVLYGDATVRGKDVLWVWFFMSEG